MVSTNTTWSWSERSSLDSLGIYYQTAKRAVQRVVALPNQPEISAADDAAICLGLRTFTYVKMSDPDQRDVLAADWLYAAVFHRLLPLDAVGLDGKVVQVVGEDGTGFMDDGLSTLLRCRTIPNHWPDTKPSTRRTSPITGIGKLASKPFF